MSEGNTQDECILAVLMNTYININDQIKSLKDKKENLKSNILIILKTEEIDNYISDERIKLTLKKNTRNAFDRNLFKEYCDDVENNLDYDRFTTESESETLRIVKLDKEE